MFEPRPIALVGKRHFVTVMDRYSKLFPAISFFSFGTNENLISEHWITPYKIPIYTWFDNHLQLSHNLFDKMYGLFKANHTTIIADNLKLIGFAKKNNKTILTCSDNTSQILINKFVAQLCYYSPM